MFKQKSCFASKSLNNSFVCIQNVLDKSLGWMTRWKAWLENKSFQMNLFEQIVLASNMFEQKSVASHPNRLTNNFSLNPKCSGQKSCLSDKMKSFTGIQKFASNPNIFLKCALNSFQQLAISNFFWVSWVFGEMLQNQRTLCFLSQSNVFCFCFIMCQPIDVLLAFAFDHINSPLVMALWHVYREHRLRLSAVHTDFFDCCSGTWFL